MTRTLTRPVRSRARAAVVAALLGALSCGRVLAADPAIAVVVAAGSAIAIRDRVQLANVFRRKLRVDASVRRSRGQCSASIRT
jgi:hypothetical protein